MKVKDDGKSFKLEPNPSGKGGNRLGLLGMRERLEMVGGHFAIEAAPGKGTTIIATVPFKPTAAKAKLKIPIVSPTQSKHLLK